MTSSESDYSLKIELKPLLAPRHGLKKIISGGQSGADRAALEAALLLGIRTGGLAPPRFMTTEGKKPELGWKFSLTEMYYSDVVSVGMAYALRSKSNVDSADVTLAFRIRASPGTDNTIGYCLTGKWKSVKPRLDRPVHRPVLIITESVQNNLDMSSDVWEDDRRRLHEFLAKHNAKTMNVVGHRQTSSDPTWQVRVQKFLEFALS